MIKSYREIASNSNNGVLSVPKKVRGAKPFTPVEFHQIMGEPRKTLHKDMLYTAGKIILSSLQWSGGNS